VSHSPHQQFPNKEPFNYSLLKPVAAKMATFPTDALSTRCANPEYQLDVDVMILEYLLHVAIRNYFKLFNSTSNDGLTNNKADAAGNGHDSTSNGNGNGDWRENSSEPEGRNLEEEAERVLTAFDCESFSKYCLRDVTFVGIDNRAVQADVESLNSFHTYLRNQSPRLYLRAWNGIQPHPSRGCCHDKLDRARFFAERHFVGSSSDTEAMARRAGDFITGSTDLVPTSRITPHHNIK
jgi:hypothetical protein